MARMVPVALHALIVAALVEYLRRLLHAKTLTVDDELALFGSPDMDRSSFELRLPRQ